MNKKAQTVDEIDFKDRLFHNLIRFIIDNDIHSLKKMSPCSESMKHFIFIAQLNYQ